MSNKEKKSVHQSHTTANYTFGSDSGSQKTAFAEVGIVAPANTGPSGPAWASRFEGFNYPRAIISRMKQYNADFQFPAASTNPNYISGEYFAQTAT